MFGFDRNGLQVGQVTSWVFVVGVSPVFPCVIYVHCVQAFGPLQTWHTSRAVHLPRDRIHSSVTWPRDGHGHLFLQHSIYHLSVDERAHQNEAVLAAEL